MGEGFDFVVSIGIVWRAAPHVSVSRLLKRAQEHQTEVWETVEVTVREVARCCPPNQPAWAEEQITDRLRCLAREWHPRAHRRRVEGLRWEVLVRVDADEPVRELLRLFLAERLEHDALVSYSGAQVKAMRDLTAQWRGFLADLSLDDPREERPPAYLAPHLARLAAQPDKADETVEMLARAFDRQRHDLLRVTQDAIKANQGVNTYEFLMTYESALTLLLKHVGSLPPKLGESLMNGSG